MAPENTSESRDGRPLAATTYLACFWLWEIPLAYLLARVMRLGPFGAFLAIMLGYSSLALLLVLFRRGRWKLRAV